MGLHADARPPRHRAAIGRNNLVVVRFVSAPRNRVERELRIRGIADTRHPALLCPENRGGECKPRREYEPKMNSSSHSAAPFLPSRAVTNTTQPGHITGNSRLFL